MNLSNIFSFLLGKKRKSIPSNNLTCNVQKGICPLCKKKDEICTCTILNCHCNIVSIKCDWPDCVCESCLEMPESCRCKNE